MKFEEFIKYWFKIEENNNNDNIKDSFYLARYFKENKINIFFFYKFTY